MDKVVLEIRGQRVAQLGRLAAYEVLAWSENSLCLEVCSLWV
jgi:hypothetical protein